MPLILGANSVRGAAVHQIAQSIRFNDDDSPALNKTYSGAGSRVKFTYSCWLKVATTDTGSGFPLFNGGTGTSDTTWSGVAYYQGMIYAQGYNTNWRITTRKLRDPAAWYHIVYVWDTGQVADTERIKIFINGVRETEFSTLNHPAKDAQSGINQAAQHSIGYQSRTVGYVYADAYMTEMVFIDGQALDPSSFAEYNENGIWVPKDVSGLTFGTNGFHIDGRDSADLGDDESGQGNDYTSTGLAAHDQVSDSPTNNFCVMSPIDKTFNSMSEGNLKTTGGTNNTGGRGTMGFKSGKWYWEMYVNTYSDTYPGSGVVYPNYLYGGNNYAGGATDLGAGAAHTGNNWYKQSTSNTQYGSAPSSGNIYMYALDRDNNKIYWGVDGTWRNSGDPAGGTGAVADSLSHYDDGTWMPYVTHGSNAGASVGTFNFGQDGTFAGATTAGGNSDGNGIGNFKYSVPSGFLALCTKNLGS